MAFPPRLYGASVAFSRRAIYLMYIASVAFARRCHGVHGARVELLPRLQGVFTAFPALARSFCRVQWRFMIKKTQN